MKSVKVLRCSNESIRLGHFHWLGYFRRFQPIIKINTVYSNDEWDIFSHYTKVHFAVGNFVKLFCSWLCALRDASRVSKVFKFGYFECYCSWTNKKINWNLSQRNAWPFLSFDSWWLFFFFFSRWFAHLTFSVFFPSNIFRAQQFFFCLCCCSVWCDFFVSTYVNVLNFCRLLAFARYCFGGNVEVQPEKIGAALWTKKKKKNEKRTGRKIKS